MFNLTNVSYFNQLIFQKHVLCSENVIINCNLLWKRLLAALIYCNDQLIICNVYVFKRRGTCRYLL